MQPRGFNPQNSQNPKRNLAILQRPSTQRFQAVIRNPEPYKPWDPAYCEETIQPDMHTPGSALPASTYAADVGYLVDGTPMDRAGNLSVQ